MKPADSPFKIRCGNKGGDIDPVKQERVVFRSREAASDSERKLITCSTNFLDHGLRKVCRAAVRVCETDTLTADSLFYDALATAEFTDQRFPRQLSEDGMLHGVRADFEAITLQGKHFLPGKKSVHVFYRLRHRMLAQPRQVPRKLFPGEPLARFSETV